MNDSRLYHNADSLVQQLRYLADDVKANPKKARAGEDLLGRWASYRNLVEGAPKT